ncbi:TLDc domain-containing protein [Entamoeba marina]
MLQTTKSLKDIIINHSDLLTKWTSLGTQRFIFSSSNPNIDIPRFIKCISHNENIIIAFRTTDNLIYGTFNSKSVPKNEENDIFEDEHHFLFQLAPPQRYNRINNTNSFRIFPWKRKSKLVCCIPGAILISNPTSEIYPFITYYYENITWEPRIFTIKEIVIVQCIGRSTKIKEIEIEFEPLEEIYQQRLRILKTFFNTEVNFEILGKLDKITQAGEFNKLIQKTKGFIVLIQTIEGYVFGSYTSKILDKQIENTKDFVDDEHFAFSLKGVSVINKKFIKKKPKTKSVRYYPNTQDSSIFGIPRFYFIHKDEIKLAYDFSVYYLDVPVEGVELFANGIKKPINYVVQTKEIWVISVF